MKKPDFSEASTYTTFRDGAWRLRDGKGVDVYVFKDEEEKNRLAQKIGDSIWNAYINNSIIYKIQKHNKPSPKRFKKYKYYLHGVSTKADLCIVDQECYCSDDSISYLIQFSTGYTKAFIYRTQSDKELFYKCQKTGKWFKTKESKFNPDPPLEKHFENRIILPLPPNYTLNK